MPEIVRKPKGTAIKEEQETAITICPTTKKAVVCSTIPATIRKLYDFAEQYDDAKITIDNAFCLAIEVPMNWIRVRPPVKRTLTGEQRKAAADRLAKAKAKK